MHWMLAVLLLGGAGLGGPLAAQTCGNGTTIAPSLTNFSATYVGASIGCQNAIFTLQFTVAPFDSCNDPDPTVLQLRAVDPFTATGGAPINNVVWVSSCREGGGNYIINVAVPYYPSGFVDFELWIMPSTANGMNCAAVNPTVNPLNPVPIQVPDVPQTVTNPSVFPVPPANEICEVIGGDVVFNWTIPTWAVYTNIIVQRVPLDNLGAVPECFTLAGGATTFTDTPPTPTGGNTGYRYFVYGLLGGSCSTVNGSCKGFAVECDAILGDDCFAKFDIADAVPAVAGSTVEVPVYLHHGGLSNLGMVAFGFGAELVEGPGFPLGFDLATHIDPLGMTNVVPLMAPFPANPGMDLAAIVPMFTEFTSREVAATTFTPPQIQVGALMDLDNSVSPGVWTPIPTTGNDPLNDANRVEIARLVFVIDPATPPGEYFIDFASILPLNAPVGTLPNPPVEAIVLKPNPVPTRPPIDVQVADEDLMAMGGSIIVEPPPFQIMRGDHNQSQSTTVTDVVIAQRFQLGLIPEIDVCVKQMDWDASGAVEATDIVAHSAYFSPIVGAIEPACPSEVLNLMMQNILSCGPEFPFYPQLSCFVPSCPEGGGINDCAP